MDRLLSLQQMADLLGVSAQTFRKDVKDRGIPHITVGKRARFDPLKVQAYLVAKAEEPSNVIQLKLPKPAKPRPVASRFAQHVNVDLHR